MSVNTISNSDLCVLLIDAIRKDEIDDSKVGTTEQIGRNVTDWLVSVTTNFDSRSKEIIDGGGSKQVIANALHDVIGADILSLKLRVNSIFKHHSDELKETRLAKLAVSITTEKLQKAYSKNRKLTNMYRPGIEDIKTDANT